MSGTATTLSRKARREEAHRKLRQRKIMTTAVFVIGFMLVVWAVYTVVSIQQRNKAALDYTAADIVYDKPIQASHEMGAGAAIPFLPRNQPQPAVLAPEKFYDFGQVGPQDVVERQFILRNTGDAPLTISRAYTTCGCTTANISASVIPPGKVAEITLIFDAGYHSAPGQTVRRGLIIENNDPQQSQVEIWIQASVRGN